MSTPDAGETPPIPGRTRLFITCWILSALFNVSWGIIFPLRSLFFREPWVGLSFKEIGWIGFVRAAVSTTFPLVFGILSDRWGRQKPWILGGFALSSVATALYLFGRGFLFFAVLTVFATLGMIAYNLNINALATMTLADNARGRQFGQYRISGSVGYALASFFLLPLVARDPTYKTTFLVGGAIYIVCLLIAQIGIHEVPTEAKGGPNLRAWRQVFRHRNLRVLYLCMAFGAIGGSMAWGFFANHLDETYGLSKAWIGILTGLQTVTEIPALILLGWASDRWGRKPILVFAYFANGLRWAWIGLAPTAGWVVPAQLLWGIGFSNLIVSVALITDLVDANARTTALGVMSLAWGIGGIVGPPIGGYLADQQGLPIVFQLGGGLVILAGIALWILLRVETKGLPPDVPAVPRAHPIGDD